MPPGKLLVLHNNRYLYDSQDTS